MPANQSLLLVHADREFSERLARRFLELGFAVTVLNHPRHAMQAVSFRQFAVAVVDQCLPETGGIELMEHLLRHIDTKVVILSACNDPALELAALRRGAYAVLPKSGALDQLPGVVEQALLRHSPRERTSQLESPSNHSGHSAILN